MTSLAGRARARLLPTARRGSAPPSTACRCATEGLLGEHMLAISRLQWTSWGCLWVGSGYAAGSCRRVACAQAGCKGTGLLRCCPAPARLPPRHALPGSTSASLLPAHPCRRGMGRATVSAAAASAAAALCTAELPLGS